MRVGFTWDCTEIFEILVEDTDAGWQKKERRKHLTSHRRRLPEGETRPVPAWIIVGMTVPYDLCDSVKGLWEAYCDGQLLLCSHIFGRCGALSWDGALRILAWYSDSLLAVGACRMEVVCRTRCQVRYGGNVRLRRPSGQEGCRVRLEYDS